MASRWRPVSVSCDGLGDPQHQLAALVEGELEAELGVADPDLVHVVQRRLAVQVGAVQIGAVGRVEILDEVGVAAAVDAAVDPGGEPVLDPDVGVVGAPDRDAAEEVDAARPG